MEPTFVHIRVPGCAALAFDHFLRAVFCVIEDGDLPVDEGRLDAQTALCGFFQAEGRSVPELLAEHGSDRRFLSVILAEPLTVRTNVYEYLISRDPELAERRPRVFGSVENFLFADRDPITAGLCRALGAKRATGADFDFLAPDDGDTPTAFARRALDFLSPLPPARSVTRTRRLLENAARRECVTRPEPLDDGNLRRKFRKQNRLDYKLYEEAITRLEKNASKGRRAVGGGELIQTSSEPVFVFNHLPKCYGSSLRVLLARAFSVIEDHTEFLGVADVVADAPCETARLRSDTILCGHFCDGAYRLPVRYPELWSADSRFRIFTFLRDPLAMAVSNFHHIVEREPDRVAKDPGTFGSLEKFLSSIHNPLAFRLGCDESNWEATLARYFFVGVAERFEEQFPILLDRMAGELNGQSESSSVARARRAITTLRAEKLPHENPRKTRALDEISSSVLERFNRQNALDLKIYHTFAAA